ncbi:MAG: SCO family protein [Halocynthiibacter sp.]
MPRIAIIFSIIAIVVLLGASWFFTRSTGNDIFAECRASSVAGGSAAIGGPFELIDEDGNTVTDKDVITDTTLVYFGYTFCPDVCPLDNARNAEAVSILEEAGKIVKPVFISIDPARDTPAHMKEFTDIMHPRMLGLTGTPEQTQAASKAYRTYYKRNENEDNPEYYLMDHSTFTYLMHPKYGFLDFFKRDDSPQQMADRVSCFVDIANEN